MKVSCLAGLPLIALALASPAFAKEPDWLARCSVDLGDGNGPESASFVYETRGHVLAPARGMASYSATVSSRDVTYLKERDLLNAYVGPSIDIGYVIDGEGETTATVAHVSIGASGKAMKPIPGGPITLKLVIDGKSFGPYVPEVSSSGSYSVWLDTADTDGDGKPPVLKPAEFAPLAKAVDAMTTGHVVLVQNGADIVTAQIPTPSRAGVRVELKSWTINTNYAQETGGCPRGSNQVN